jgi:O-antigen/teichoic acid export membrane protein
MAAISGTDADLGRAASGVTGGSARTLARAAFGSFGLNVFNTAATVLTTIVLARVMGVTEYGTFAFVIATVILLGVPAVLGVDRLLIRDVAVHVRSGDFGLARGLVRWSVRLTVALSLAIGAGAAVVAWLVAGGEATPAVTAFTLGALSLPLLGIVRATQGGLMGLGQIVAGQFSELMLRPIAFLTLVVAALMLLTTPITAPTAVGLYGLSLAIACAAGFALYRTRAPIAMRTSRPEYMSSPWLRAAVALVILSSTAVINSQTGVVLLGALDGADAAGLYSVAQRGALLVAFPLAAVNSALAPTVARMWSAGELASLQRLVTLSARGLLIGTLPMALLFIVFGRQILGFFFGEAFAAADLTLAILCIGQLVNALTGSVGTLLVMTGRERIATVALAAGAGLNILIAIALIPSFGVIGAAVAAAASLVVSNIAMVFITRRQLGIDSTALGIPPRSGPTPTASR